MATLSNADTIQDGDRFTTVKVTLYIEVNRDAYEREYGRTSIRDMKESVQVDVFRMVEDGDNLYPAGIIHDVTLA